MTKEEKIETAKKSEKTLFDTFRELPTDVRDKMAEDARRTMIIRDLAEKAIFAEMATDQDAKPDAIDVNSVARRIVDMLNNKDERARLADAYNLSKGTRVLPETVLARLRQADISEERSKLSNNSDYTTKLLIAVLMTEKSHLRPETLVKNLEKKLEKHHLSIADLLTDLSEGGISAGSKLDGIYNEILTETSAPGEIGSYDVPLNKAFHEMWRNTPPTAKDSQTWQAVNAGSDRDPDYIYFLYDLTTQDDTGRQLLLNRELTPLARRVLITAGNLYLNNGERLLTVNRIWRGIGGKGQPSPAMVEEIKSAVEMMRTGTITITRELNGKEIVRANILPCETYEGIFNNKPTEYIVKIISYPRIFTEFLNLKDRQRTKIHHSLWRTPLPRTGENIALEDNLLHYILMQNHTEKSLTWDTIYDYADNLSEKEREYRKENGLKLPRDDKRWRLRVREKVEKITDYWKDIEQCPDPILKECEQDKEGIIFTRITAEEKNALRLKLIQQKKKEEAEK